MAEIDNKKKTMHKKVLRNQIMTYAYGLNDMVYDLLWTTC